MNYMFEGIFWEMIVDEDKALQFCIDHNLLKNNMICCGKLLEIRHKVDNKKNKGYYFRCNKDSCRKEVTVRKNSFFEGSSLRLGQVLMLIYMFSQKDTKYESITRKTGIKSHQTIANWLNYCREICEMKLCSLPMVLGGVGKIVEIDESVLVRRKYNRGRRVLECWVFCMYDVETKDAFAIRVQDRSRETLFPLIQQYILPGSTVHTDGAKVYLALNNLDYIHYSCNHSIGEWVNYETGATVNHVESFWQKLKNDNKIRFGTHRTTLDSHISEFLWHRKFESDARSFFEHISEFYPLNEINN